MMKIILRTLLLTCLCLFMAVSYAGTNERIPLWGATFFGMSLKEVLASVPNAQATASNIKPSFLNPNDQALAKLDNIEIAGEAFSAWFIFNNGKLHQVTLSLIPKVTGTEASMPSDYLSALYSHFSLLLSAKYGNSTSITRKDYAPTNTHLWNTQWIFGLTDIDLNVDKSQLEINYSAQYADDLRKL